MILRGGTVRRAEPLIQFLPQGKRSERIRDRRLNSLTLERETAEASALLFSLLVAAAVSFFFLAPSCCCSLFSYLPNETEVEIFAGPTERRGSASSADVSSEADCDDPGRVGVQFRMREIQRDSIVRLVVNDFGVPVEFYFLVDVLGAVVYGDWKLYLLYRVINV